MAKQDFLAIILGTDLNAYNMARSVHMAYGKKALVIGKFLLSECKYSKILNYEIVEDFDTDEVFLREMKRLARLKEKYHKLVLISSSDRYSELITTYKHILKADFVVQYVDLEMKLRLENKEDFYALCEKYNLPYPKTYIVRKSDGYDNLNLPFDYPVILKPSNSITYFEADIIGKKKAYKIDSADELKSCISNIYASTYEDNLIIQDFIPGGDNTMYVMNSYSSGEGKVLGMCLGQCVLSDNVPFMIGNYNAIIQCENKELYEKYQRFLEEIGYIGFSNFDFKYDIRDNTYKVFEINIRQGRSSFFTAVSGFNLAKYLIDDVVYGKTDSRGVNYHNNPSLWLNLPFNTVLKHSPYFREKLLQLKNEGRVNATLDYKCDMSLKRWLLVKKYYFNRAKNFEKFLH